jgi:hypothetical protein
MRAPVALGVTVASVGLVVLASWWLDISLERAVYLAPVIVVSFGALAALVVLWTRVVLDPVLRRRREQG